jgi:predicted RNA-binding Zn-ribbon protein involved in translation (DUF1610 family)
MNMMWKTWKRISRGEYWFAKIPEHPNADKNGYVLEHRIIMENLLNRVLQSSEIVHHENKNTKDNRPENLKLMNKGIHAREHNLERGRIFVKLRCPNCGKQFIKAKNQTHLTAKRNSATFCSLKCSGKHKHNYEPNIIEVFKTKNSGTRDKAKI